MNCGYNYSGCGLQNYYTPCNFYPMGYGGFNTGYGFGGYGFSSGGGWFAIVLVVFLLLIICGCTKIC